MVSVLDESQDWTDRKDYKMNGKNKQLILIDINLDEEDEIDDASSVSSSPFVSENLSSSVNSKSSKCNNSR